MKTLKYTIEDIHHNIRLFEEHKINNIDKILTHLCEHKEQYKEVLNQPYSKNPELGENSYQNVYFWLARNDYHSYLQPLISEIDFSIEVRKDKNILGLILEHQCSDDTKKIVVDYIIKNKIPYEQWAGKHEILKDGGLFGDKSNTVVPFIVQQLYGTFSLSNTDIFLLIETNIGLQAINEFLSRTISLTGMTKIATLATYINKKTDNINNLKCDLTKTLYLIGHNSKKNLEENFNKRTLEFKDNYIEKLFTNIEYNTLIQDSNTNKTTHQNKIKL